MTGGFYRANARDEIKRSFMSRIANYKTFKSLLFLNLENRIQKINFLINQEKTSEAVGQ